MDEQYHFASDNFDDTILLGSGVEGLYDAA